MCGLFGWQWRQQSVPTRDKRVVLATMLGDRNDNRGGKSWGWCATPTTQRTNFAIARGLGLIVSQAPAMATFSSLMGHTRQPTVGAVIKENSHPFEIGNIIGAHNGMVSNWRELETTYPNRKSFAVDSMHIFAHLNEGKDMKELQSYGAIEWIERNQKPSHFLLCKLSDSGDLAIARTSHGIVWSSTKAALEAAMEAAELDIDHMVKIPKGHVIEIHDGEAWETDREIEISTYYRTSYASTSGGQNSYYADQDYVGWWNRNGGTDTKSGSKDQCENSMCGSPLDESGDCMVMFDEKCTGAAAGIINQGMMTNLPLSQPPSCKEALADPEVKAVCDSVCESCKAGSERDGAGWHNGLEGSMKVSRLCSGPEYHVASLYVRTIALFKQKAGTVEEALRERFKIVKKSWGWAVYDDKTPWSLASFYKTLGAMECGFCHSMKSDKSVKGLCESCQKKLDDKELHVCGEEGCLAVPPRKEAEFCSRHECADETCKKQSKSDSIYCTDCWSGHHKDEKKQLALVPPAPTQPDAKAN